jgi:hypothetical protein
VTNGTSTYTYAVRDATQCRSTKRKSTNTITEPTTNEVAERDPCRGALRDHERLAREH